MTDHEPAENQTGAPVYQWLAMPLDTATRHAIDRARHADDVAHLAVMPDVHLATDVCVGTAMATRRLVYPGAVGGDIGCGMLAMAFDASADVLRDATNAGALLNQLGARVPAHRHHRLRARPLADDLSPNNLSHPALQKVASDEGRLQLGTLGGGNHFIEMQTDEDDRLWLMIHSGSRAMGQVVRSHHVARATRQSAGLPVLSAEEETGQTYLNDQVWACRYADANRRAMAMAVAEILNDTFGITEMHETTITCDHNHVRRESHFGESFFVHRKGAMPADAGLAGVVPGSMGTLSYHVVGRGCDRSLRSSAHGAGRVMSRRQARERFGKSDLKTQMSGVWYDPRIQDALREESPKAYKDVRAVLRAQSELTAITRMLRPVIVYKGA